MNIFEPLPKSLCPTEFKSLKDLLDYVAITHQHLPAFTCAGLTLSYREIDELSTRFAAYLQTETSLVPGDRIAIQLPNLLQFPIALFGAIKAGLVVVSTNPLYTAHEMKHQFRDSGAKGIVILESFCQKLEEILPNTQIETVIVATLGDIRSAVARFGINFIAKYVKGVVPAYSLKGAVYFAKALKNRCAFNGSLSTSLDETAVLLYTGGTTGVAKGAMLSHRNILTNMMQLRARSALLIEDQIETLAAPLPLYHSYAFLLHCFAMPYAGNHNLLIPNPRDIKGMIKLFSRIPVNGFVGINTLYLGLLRDPSFEKLDLSTLKFCGAGGMAMTTSVAEEWFNVTGVEILEGYGLTECSPVVSVNIPGKAKLGTVGPVVPETEVKIVDEDEDDVPMGATGELWIRGPQVMLGYWQQPTATREVINSDGWFKTGDYAQIDDDGYIKIVDRKKDMILVSGFNVFPNEIEDWVNNHPYVLESAAIGVPNERSGEAVKLFVVASKQPIDHAEIIQHCRAGLTSYKVPKEVVFVDDLPKSIIGKILRRELR